MYRPKAFHVEDDVALASARQIGFGHLVVAAEDQIHSAPMPFLIDEHSGLPILLAHVALANPMVDVIGEGAEALVIVAGADAYVSPSWYPSKQEHGRVVPTWNYTVVHLRGEISVFRDDERIGLMVSALTNHHERDRAEPWAVTDAPAEFISAQRRAIVGLEMSLTSVEGKAKLSQNRSAADRTAVVTGLLGGHLRDQAVGTEMGDSQ